MIGWTEWRKGSRPMCVISAASCAALRLYTRPVLTHAAPL